MKTTIIALALFVFCTEGKAQKVTVADVEALPGETVSFTLDLTGGKVDTYTAMQFDAQFPVTGFSTTGDYDVSKLWKNATATIGAVSAEGVATVPVASSESISAADVEGLFSVSFTVDGGVALGNYDVTLKNLWFGYGTSSKDYLDDVTFTVQVVDAHSIVLDENSTTAPEAAEDVNVTVKRTISANTWSTICLPFAMTEEQVKTAFGDDVQLAEFTGYEATEDGVGDIVEIKVNFSDATAIAANHPCLIKVSENVTQFIVEGVDIAPEEEPTVATVKRTKKQWSEMVGTYAATTVEDQMLFLSGNKFWYSTGSSKIKGYRAWFDFYDVLTEVESSSARVSMFFDEVITDINKVSEKKSNMSGAIFDLQGRRVNKPVRGIFVKDGNKIVIEN